MTDEPRGGDPHRRRRRRRRPGGRPREAGDPAGAEPREAVAGAPPPPTAEGDRRPPRDSRDVRDQRPRDPRDARQPRESRPPTGGPPPHGGRGQGPGGPPRPRDFGGGPRPPGGGPPRPGPAPPRPAAGPPRPEDAELDGGEADDRTPARPLERVADARWGDDSDAPTPEVKLQPDLPGDEDDGEPVWPDAPPRPGVLANVCGVKFSVGGKIYEVDAGDATYAAGDAVIVETDRGPLQAAVAIATRREIVPEPLRRVLRRADARDLENVGRYVDRAREALRAAKERAHTRRLPVKMFRVDILPGGQRAIVYFSADERIDFRDLVRDLAHDLRLRIEMRQTGVRDEAKLVGGIGSCGRELCCTTFLPHFDPVSIRMAKDQGLVLNPTKVSGQCGRLKCCLVYEEAIYREMRKGLPKMGKRVTTPAGEGRVAEIDVLRQRIRVAFEPGEFQTFPADAVAALAPPPMPPGKKVLPVVPPDEEDP